MKYKLMIKIVDCN